MANIGEKTLVEMDDILSCDQRDTNRLMAFLRHKIATQLKETPQPLLSGHDVSFDMDIDAVQQPYRRQPASNDNDAPNKQQKQQQLNTLPVPRSSGIGNASNASFLRCVSIQRLTQQGLDQDKTIGINDFLPPVSSTPAVQKHAAGQQPPQAVAADTGEGFCKSFEEIMEALRTESPPKESYKAKTATLVKDIMKRKATKQNMIANVETTGDINMVVESVQTASPIKCSKVVVRLKRHDRQVTVLQRIEDPPQMSNVNGATDHGGTKAAATQTAAKETDEADVPVLMTDKGTAVSVLVAGKGSLPATNHQAKALIIEKAAVDVVRVVEEQVEVEHVEEEDVHLNEEPVDEGTHITEGPAETDAHVEQPLEEDVPVEEESPVKSTERLTEDDPVPLLFPANSAQDGDGLTSNPSQNNNQSENTSTRLLDLHCSSVQPTTKSKTRTVINLNKPSKPAINGEQFAKELARESNHKILDLRKQNSKQPKDQQQGTTKDDYLVMETEIKANNAASSYLSNETSNFQVPLAPTAKNKKHSKQKNTRKRNRPQKSEQLLRYENLSKTIELRMKSRADSGNITRRCLYNKGDSDEEHNPTSFSSMAPAPSLITGNELLIAPPPPQIAVINDENIPIVPPPPASIRYSQLQSLPPSEEVLCVELVAPPKKQYRRKLALLERASTTHTESNRSSVCMEALRMETPTPPPTPLPPPPPLSNSIDQQLLDDQPSTSKAARELLNASLTKKRQKEKKKEREEKIKHQGNPKKTLMDRTMSQLAINLPKELVMPNESNVSEDHNTSGLRRSRRGLVPLKNAWSHTIDDPFAFMRPLVKASQPAQKRESLLNKNGTLKRKRKDVLESQQDIVHKKRSRRIRHEDTDRTVAFESEKVRQVEENRDTVPITEQLQQMVESQVEEQLEIHEAIVETQQEETVNQTPHTQNLANPNEEVQQRVQNEDNTMELQTPQIELLDDIQQEEIGSPIPLQQFPVAQNEDIAMEEQFPAADPLQELHLDELINRNLPIKKRKQKQTMSRKLPEKQDKTEVIQPIPISEPRQIPVEMEDSALDKAVLKENQAQVDNLDDHDGSLWSLSASSDEPLTLAQLEYSQWMSWLRGEGDTPDNNNDPKEKNDNHGLMITTTKNQLDFSNFKGLEYAFYQSNSMGSLGYMRFKPHQQRGMHKSKTSCLNFVVLYGNFEFQTSDASEEQPISNYKLGVGDFAQIGKGTYFNIKNLLNEAGVILVNRVNSQ